MNNTMDEENVCAICQDTMDEPHTVACCHQYHKECISNELVKCCPICRFDQVGWKLITAGKNNNETPVVQTTNFNITPRNLFGDITPDKKIEIDYVSHGSQILQDRLSSTRESIIYKEIRQDRSEVIIMLNKLEKVDEYYFLSVTFNFKRSCDSQFAVSDPMFIEQFSSESFKERYCNFYSYYSDLPNLMRELQTATILNNKIYFNYRTSIQYQYEKLKLEEMNEPTIEHRYNQSKHQYKPSLKYRF